MQSIKTHPEEAVLPSTPFLGARCFPPGPRPPPSRPIPREVGPWNPPENDLNPLLLLLLLVIV